MQDEEIMFYDERYSKKLLKIKKFPTKLYYLGNDKLLNCPKRIAIVGARDCSTYGRKYAQSFSKTFAKKGVCIISGMALGIDTAAHYGALYEKGKTIAVLAGGLDNIYPSENMWLYDLILKNGGCIVTEHETGIETVMKDFPKRNRIISGMADAVLVIEANHRSGSRITARYAKEQGKRVYCLPGDIDRTTSIGTAELIQEGATLVTRPEQVIDDLYGSNTFEVVKGEQQKMFNTIPNEYRVIYELLNNEDMCSNEIAMRLKINVAELNAMLTMMELEGYIEQKPGYMFSIRKG